MAVNNVQDLTNPMPHYEGMAPGLNTTGSIPNLAFLPRIVAKTADYTILPEESGTRFVTIGTTADIEFTLPAVGDGPWEFTIYHAADIELTVSAETAGTMVAYNDLTADALVLTTASEHIGGGVRCFCDGTWVYAWPILGDGRYQTVGITSA